MRQIENQLKDFAKANFELFWQRQATLAGASLLAAYYLNIQTALLCYCIVQLAELFDHRTVKRVLKWDGKDATQAAFLLNQLTISSISCSVSIVLYAIMVAMSKGPSIHLGPLFFLLAATLYAAMNNCQIPRVLITRLIIYSAGFVFIPVYDVLLVRPPFNSDLWMQLGVVLFVLYFLIECSRKFLQNYTIGLEQLDALRVERDRVSEAYKMQSQFVSVVSHELRTPLTAVRASLDLLNNKEMGTLPDGLSNVAKIGQKSSNHLAVLIDDLLDFQKLKAGKMTFNFSKIELRQFIRDAVEVNRAFGDTQSVDIKIAELDDPIYIEADHDRMMQVISNVLSNAIKFSHPSGTIEISIENGGATCRILIRDEGIGIPEASEDVVFAPFKQVDGSDKREVGGTGLGMSITRSILESHRGTISYSSRLGIGTTFCIELDQYPSDQSASAKAADPTPDETRRAASPDRGQVSSIFPRHDGSLSSGYGAEITPETP